MTPIALYLTLLVAVVIQEEAAPIAGALAAHHEHLDPVWVWLACAAGSWSGDLGLYFVGRRGRRLLQRPGFAKALEFVGRHPRSAPLVARFAYGLRLTLPLACGASHMPLSSFALWVGTSALLWSATFTLVGWTAGEMALRLFHDMRHYELPLIAITIAAWLTIVAWRRVRRAGIKPGGPAVAGA